MAAHFHKIQSDISGSFGDFTLQDLRGYIHVFFNLSTLDSLESSIDTKYIILVKYSKLSMTL